MRASSGSRIPVRTARCSRVAGSQSNASRTSLLARDRGGGRRSMTAREAAVRPSATMMSVVSRTGAQPSAIKRFVPTDDGLRTEPGTAMTGMSRSAASFTVSSEPPAAWDSTTTTRCDSAAMMRLRAGNRHASGRAPSGASLRSRPRRADALPQVSVPGRVHDVEPAPDHTDRAATGVEHAAVGGAVDAEGEAGDHGDPRVGELATHLAREPRAGARAPARAHDRDPDLGEGGEVALREAAVGRRVEVGAEALGVARVAGMEGRRCRGGLVGGERSLRRASCGEGPVVGRRAGGVDAAGSARWPRGRRRPRRWWPRAGRRRCGRRAAPGGARERTTARS